MSNTSDTRTIYEIFRACRLCGAGGGYKMPIVQNFIPFNYSDVDLREKIRECVHIEVREDDKMPPLICELCVDKVNDFYEFVEMCQLTNKRTRERLGLPPQTIPQGAPDDCILGVTETVFSNDEEKQQRSRPCPKSKKNTVSVKKEDVKTETPKRGKGKETQGDVTSKKLAKELGKLKTAQQTNNYESPRTSGKRETCIYVDSRSSSVSTRSSPAPARESRRKASVEQSETSRMTRNRRDSLASNSSARPTTRRSANDDSLSLERIKQQSETPRVTRNRRDSLASNSSARPTTRRSANDDSLSLEKIKQQELKKKQEQQKQTTKTVQKKGKYNNKVEASSDSDNEALPLSTRRKRGRDIDTPKAEVPLKKIRLTIKLPPKPAVPALKPNKCPVCDFVASSSGPFTNHMRSHPVGFTSPDAACDPCGEWFPSAEAAGAHHRRHGRYRCRRCRRDYRHLATYYEHFEKNNCKLFEELPDVQCQTCWAFFPTAPLMQRHTCPGTGSRPGGACKICTKLFTTQKSLKRHEEYCASKSKDSKSSNSETCKPAKSEVSKPAKSEVSKPAKNEASRSAKPAKSEVRISARVRSRLRAAAVRVAKCDPLLRTRRTRAGRYNVADVPHDFGLDKNCTYPFKYSGIRVKSEPLCFNGMVSINKEIQQELYREEDYVHWDSDLSSDSDNEVEEFGEKRRKVPTLTALTLKTIFSKRCLGKVPRKLRKVKQDKLFDSLFNTKADDDIACNINSIIDSLSKEDSGSVNLLNIGVNYDSDSVLGGDDFDAVIKDVNKNCDFDLNASAETKNDDTTDLESKNYLNDGDDTDASMNDGKENHYDDLAETNGVSKENINNDNASDRTEDLSSQNGDTQDEIFNTSENTLNNLETIQGTEEDEATNNETANVNSALETKNDHENTNKENIESNNDFEEKNNQNTDDDKESNVGSDETHTKNEETYKNGDYLNGDLDKSDNFVSDIDDKLMDDLNAQIDESEMKDIEVRPLDACGNFSIESLIDKSMSQSFGLGSIGDEEFL